MRHGRLAADVTKDERRARDAPASPAPTVPCHDRSMARPYAAYLRVYEPLSAFGDPPDERLVTAARSAPLSVTAAAEREQEVWLRSQMSAPPRLLPAERADGTSAPSNLTDVLVLRPDDVPSTEHSESTSELLVCPLEVRARSAAALVSFLGDAPPALRTAVLNHAGCSVEAARTRATAALSDAYSGALHVLSVTWTIPLPWFTLIDPAERKLVLGGGVEDPQRELSWRVNMVDARRRVAVARELAEQVVGDEGPARILADTDQWLATFDARSAVELDYGGLVQLMDDETLESDTSAEDVHAILDSISEGDIERLRQLYDDLRTYWGSFAARERCN